METTQHNGSSRSGRYPELFTLPSDAQRRAFADMREFYPTRTIARGPQVRELRLGQPVDFHYEADGHSLGIDDFMRRGGSTGLLILKRGQVVCERYAHGHTAQTRWLSFSMAKSITSTLIGVAMHDGVIASLEDPVTLTVPQLIGSAYDGVTIRQVLQMTSGVRWVETYLDPESDRRKLMAIQQHEEPGGVLNYLRTLPRVAEPGSLFNYNTAETFLLGAILRGAIQQPVSDYLSAKIWQPCGMESDAYWQLESEGGQEFTGSGLNATLRDYARFGAFVLADGVLDGQRVLPEGWMAQSTAVVPGSMLEPGRLTGFEPLGYGYQWWTFPSRAGSHVFGALGIFGQQIYVDVDEQLVIVLHSVWPEPVHLASRLESYSFFAAATRALQNA
ncbi:serine hydrolase domain-containing protein [Variovorax sp. PAMC 28711]|uniref:serine hydrolase domain-containing protein n=1 Tax=Variovorax sp. PAMC 28711 TaxID=1795631 RepID=UPI00078C526B|nr:serine hydrolase [Variovorax sp. PAMC 28711]AMM23745.1 hypothetical protein AX767_04850 [Variovorax sp. PAMC 28711]